MAQKRTRRRFTTEFKAQAVKRVLEGGKGLTEVATELGVSTGQLSTWRGFRCKSRHSDARFPLTSRQAGCGADPQHRAGGDGRSTAMAARVCRDRLRDTMASAIWKVIDRPWRTILAPIFTSRWRSVVIDHCLTSSGSARVRRKLPRL